MTALFFLLLIFETSTVFLENDASLDGVWGGWGALGDLFPTDASFPVKNMCAACLVRSTCNLLRNVVYASDFEFAYL